MKLFDGEPNSVAPTLAELMGLAAALETESERRYRQLAGLMERRGNSATGETFRTLAGEERGHADRVAAWSESLVGSAPDPGPLVWRLPPEIARSWDDLAGSATVTPFAALSVAVVNEERAFAFYTYIAAHSDADDVRQQAEALAREELRHAALLRRARRTAWHRDRGSMATPMRRAIHGDELRSVTRALWGRAAEIQDDLAQRLSRSGDDDGAEIVRAIADDARRVAAQAVGEKDRVATAPAPAWATLPDATKDGPARGGLLEQALGTEERLCDLFGDIAGAADREDILNRAQEMQETALRHLVLITARLEQVGWNGEATVGAP